MGSLLSSYSQHILLADDDDDDCFLFKYALEELPLSFTLTTVKNGEELMRYLYDNTHHLPDVIFLDLNMPRKNGLECLKEIKNHEKLKQIPLIIFSTSFSPDVISRLYQSGARYYIRKPDDISRYKKIINHALSLVAQSGDSQPSLENFELTEISLQ